MDKVGKIIEALINYDCPDMKRIHHALKVFGYAKAIGSKELQDEKERGILEAAAVLHDIGIHEAERIYGSSMGKYQEELGPDIARKILEPLGFQAEEIEKICFLIANHHSYHVDGGMILQILFEADFIVNVEEGNQPEIASRAGRSKIIKTKTGGEMVDKLFQW